MTPGVYIEEKNAFPGSVVEVATAIPAFIGYTERASRNGQSLKNNPTRINSFADYLVLFGGAFEPKFTISPLGNNSNPVDHKMTIGSKEHKIAYEDNNELLMYRSIRLFFANGGGTCYIVSVGTYQDVVANGISKDQLLGESKENDKPVEGGLDVLRKEQEPTMIVVPDAVNLDKNECYALYATVLAHCGNMQNRVAIVDVHNGAGKRIEGKAEDGDVIAIFRENIGSEFLNYGAAYYPWLHTSIVSSGEITFKNINDLKSLLPAQETAARTMIENFEANSGLFENLEAFKKDKEASYKNALAKDGIQEPTLQLKEVPEKLVEGEDVTPDDVAARETERQKIQDENTSIQSTFDEAKATYDARKAALDTAFAKAKLDGKDLSEDLQIEIPAVAPETDPTVLTLTNLSEVLRGYMANKQRNHHQGLVATSPTYVNILSELTAVENLLPPSAAMAGLYTMVDNTRGVWKAPANVSVNSVIKPSSKITHDAQENLNVDAMSGKSINAIRTFPGIGTMVWGGRTLDGNSLDWRYINVRRTMIMLEQSIKLALRSYVFEPNDANTWVTVRSMITNFLTEKWKQGALAGASPEDAFSVDIGLGTTMTSLDILEGKMLVTIKLAIVRPAEFIVVTFQQQMQKS
jgi:phage tail sheath protein FI